MERNKDFFTRWMEDLFFNQSPVGRMFQEMENQQLKNLEYESHEIEKNGVKTTVTYGFDEQGYLRAIKYNSSSNQSDETKNLQKQLDEAVENEDYSKAAELKSKLLALNKTN